MTDQDDETSGTVVVTLASGGQRDIIELVFDGEADDPVQYDAESLFTNQNLLKHVKNEKGKRPRGENVRALLHCDGGTLEYDYYGTTSLYKIKVKQQESDTFSPKPPSKKLKTMVGIQQLDTYSIQECPSPVNPQRSPRPFVCDSGWMKGIGSVIMGNLDKTDVSDDDRVSPLCLARCSRGGKTRSMYAIVENNFEEIMDPPVDLKYLFVSFNGDLTDVQEDEQHDPLAALTRRIAFAAHKGDKTEALFDTKFRSVVVTSDSIENWLGETKCVLLIDELNKLENIRNSVTARRDGPTTLFAEFIKKNFLKKSGRYLVFSTHEVSVDQKLSQYMDTTSNRNVTVRALPLIPSLREAQEAFDWKDLTAREAIYCGLIPGLILMQRMDDFPSLKRKVAVNQFLLGGFTEAEVLKLLKSLVDGQQGLVPRMLEQLMDTSDAGKMRWIPAHMVYVLDQIADHEQQGEHRDKNLSCQLRWLLKKICSLFGQFKDAKTYGGDGWEALFGVVLLVRILNKQSHHLIDLESFLRTAIDYTTGFNAPINVSTGRQFDDLRDVGSLLQTIPEQIEGPHVAIYYPSHASFEKYDMLVVMWGANGRRFKTIGYQLKEGKEIPSDEATANFQNFVVRGRAAQSSNYLRNWEVASNDQIVSFFGDSGGRWVPKMWKELKDSSSFDETPAAAATQPQSREAPKT